MFGRPRLFGIPKTSSGPSNPEIHSLLTFMSLRSNSDERPGVGASKRTEREARSGIEERVGNRPDRKMSRSVIRPDREAKRKKSEAGAGQPSPNRRKPARPGLFDRFVAGRLRLRWEPVRVRRRQTGHYEYGSVRGREQEGPSTPILETSAVTYQHKTEETAGGGEELEANTESGIGANARCGKVNERGQDGKRESEEATATKDEETDSEVGRSNKEGVKIRPDRKPTRSVIRLDIRKKKGARADRPTSI